MNITIKQINEYPVYFEGVLNVKYYESNKEFFILKKDGDRIAFDVAEGFELLIEE